MWPVTRCAMSRASPMKPSSSWRIIGSSSTATSCSPVEQLAEIDRVKDVTLVRELRDRSAFAGAGFLQRAGRQRDWTRYVLTIDRDEPSPAWIDDEQYRRVTAPTANAEERGHRQCGDDVALK